MPRMLEEALDSVKPQGLTHIHPQALSLQGVKKDEFSLDKNWVHSEWDDHGLACCFTNKTGCGFQGEYRIDCLLFYP